MFKTAGMPFGKTRSQQITRLQRSLIQQVLRLPREENEDKIQHQKRRHTATTEALKTTTDCRQTAARRAVDWHEHTTRNTSKRLRGAEFVRTTTAAELEEVRRRRAERGLPGLGLRAWPGHVALRWETALEHATAAARSKGGQETAAERKKND